MHIYVLQVKTGRENYFIQNILKYSSELGSRLHFPCKEEKRRRRGKVEKEQIPLFPGYVFYVSKTNLTGTIKEDLKKGPAFSRFLPDTKGPLALRDNDLVIIKSILSFGPVLKESRVYFDKNDRIIVTEGPLKGLEGHITKIDKRKSRATIVVDMYNTRYSINLSFETIELASKDKKDGAKNSLDLEKVGAN